MTNTEKIRDLIANPFHPWLGMNNEEMLRSAGFWRRDPLTNQEGYILAVVLLFGKEQTILNYCPWHRTDAIYRNMTCKRFLNPLSTDPDVRGQKYITTEKKYPS